jgi:hypothetical protein
MTSGVAERISRPGSVFVVETYGMTNHLVSTSNEASYGLSVMLINPAGRECRYQTTFNEIAPHEEVRFTVHVAPEALDGFTKVRLTFQDANGRWERTIRGARS